jgi:hypothetical protein
MLCSDIGISGLFTNGSELEIYTNTMGQTCKGKKTNCHTIENCIYIDDGVPDL